MATQIFMKLDGIQGGTQNPDFEEYFDVVSFDMGGSYNFNPATFAATGTYMAHPVSVVIKHDKMLATIFDYWQKRMETEAHIVWVQSEGDASENAIDLTLKKAFIAGVDSSVTDSEGVSIEASTNLTLIFQTFALATASVRGGAGGDMEFEVTG